MYDLIGDLHGYADELIQLLEILGYRLGEGCYRHPSRKVIFLGDFIDRGPKIGQVLHLVRPMLEAGQALAVMGNHEMNALAYHTEDPAGSGLFLRPHSPKNLAQHRETLDQLGPDLSHHLAWFRTLPLWLELDGLRVVHACWDEPAMRLIEKAMLPEGQVTTTFLRSAYREGDPLFDAVESVLKGKEAPLPAGLSFQDKDGTVRKKIRIRWYQSPAQNTYRTYALHADDIPVDVPLADEVVA